MMDRAIHLAKQAAVAAEVPIGAVVYDAAGTVLGAAHNEVITRQDATAHAEFLACQQALQHIDGPYLTDLYVAITLEPCAMCAQALSWWRVQEIRFGAYDKKSGGLESGAGVLNHMHHKPTVVGGIREAECVALLQDFFKARR